MIQKRTFSWCITALRWDGWVVMAMYIYYVWVSFVFLQATATLCHLASLPFFNLVRSCQQHEWPLDCLNRGSYIYIIYMECLCTCKRELHNHIIQGHMHVCLPRCKFACQWHACSILPTYICIGFSADAVLHVHVHVHACRYVLCMCKLSIQTEYIHRITKPHCLQILPRGQSTL